MRMYEIMSDKDPTLEEFIKDPYVVPIYAKHDPTVENLIKDIPYIKIGNIARGNYMVLYIDSRKFYDLLQVIGTSHVEMIPDALGLLGRASLDAATITRVQQHPHLDLRGQGALIGIIDTGIEYTQKTFQYEDGTSKISHLWDQTIEGVPPDAFLFGSEYTNAQINAALQTDTPHSLVPSVDTAGHGTFLASVAAGRQAGAHIGAAPDAELLVVKLRRLHPFFYDNFSIPEGFENVFSAADVMLAIEYMLDKASALQKPLAICLGLGTNMAGHDGYSILEQYINRVSQIPGICICAGAGNESNAGHHTSGAVSQKGSAYDIQIRVPENAKNFLLFIVVNPSDKMSISLVSPTGEIVPRAVPKSGSLTRTKLLLEKTIISDIYYFPVAETGVELITIGFTDPTPGIWTVTLHGDIILEGTFHAWLNMTGMVTPGVQFLTPDPFTTVVVPGTTTGCITCGAYNDRDDSLSTSSSWGFNRAMLVKPDLVAPGVNVTGIYPSGEGSMTGTSVAAAITAGACALMLQWGVVEKNDVSLNTYRIKTSLIRGCNRDPDIPYPSQYWGYGKLDLFNAFEKLRNF